MRHTKLFLMTSLALSLAAAHCGSSDSDANGAAGMGGSGGAADAGSDATAAKDIVDTAVAAGSFKTLVAAAQAAGLEATLRSAGPFTVFAPTDTAFAAVPAFLVSQLTTAPYKTELALILKYHVLAGAVKAADVLNKTQDVTTVEGGKLSVDGTSGSVVLNGGPKVTMADVLASNGVIHVIDGVLLPTIVDTAVGYDDGTTKFSQLVGAVTAADLGATLSGPGTFTVFAPTDKAFDDLKASLGQATYDAIVADKAKLTKLLTYHVLGSVAYAKDVATGDVTTVEGSTLALTAAGGAVTAGGANVVLADLPASNGVIHVIDKVLVPSDL